MKKFEIIREIFETILRVGFNDDKQDSISGYTRDKMNNPVFVKKISINGLGQVESIAVTALNSDFSDACDSDVRIAFNSNVGKRVVLYANEVEISILIEIQNYLRKLLGKNADIDAYLKVMARIEQCAKTGFPTDLTTPYVKYILNKFKETFIDENKN